MPRITLKTTRTKRVRFDITSVPTKKLTEEILKRLQDQLAARSQRDYKSHRGRYVADWVRKDKDERKDPVDVDTESDTSTDGSEIRVSEKNYRIGRFKYFVRLASPIIFV